LAIAKVDDLIDRRSWRIEIQIAKHHHVSGHSGSRVLVDIEEALLSSRKPRKEVVAPPPAMEALGFD
jgi:hypothetical protein